MHHLRPLTPLLVLVLAQLLLVLAPSPANLAPTGEDFVHNDSQYQALLERLQREAANSIILNRANFVGPDTPIEEIEKLFEQAENLPGPTTAAPKDGQPDGVNCAICLESLMDESSRGPPEAVSCGHKFHTDCIDMWRRSKSVLRRVPCPICRADIAHGPESEQLKAALARIRASPTNWIALEPLAVMPITPSRSETQRRPAPPRPSPSPQSRRADGGTKIHTIFDNVAPRGGGCQ